GHPFRFREVRCHPMPPGNSLKSLPSRRDALNTVAAMPMLAGTALASVQARAAIDEVAALMRTQQDAWNRGDIAGFCARCADDCTFLSPTGVTRGRSTLQERYTKKYGAAKETMGRLIIEMLDVRKAKESVTIAMRWSLSWNDGHPRKAPASGHTLIVWQRQPD